MCKSKPSLTTKAPPNHMLLFVNVNIILIKYRGRIYILLYKSFPRAIIKLIGIDNALLCQVFTIISIIVSLFTLKALRPYVIYITSYE